MSIRIVYVECVQNKIFTTPMKHIQPFWTELFFGGEGGGPILYTYYWS